MPRLPRFIVPGQPHHIVQRGNNHCDIFNTESDFECFRDYLQKARIHHGCHIHAYILMTNHFHLLITPDSEDSIAKTIQSVGRRYVQYFNKAYQRTGTLWEGRYRATLIDTEKYLFTCYRYIELNPVRANMVSHPIEYRWSSYHANAMGNYDNLITPHRLYLALDNDSTSRQTAYSGLFETHIDEKTLAEIRYTTQKGWILGNNRFKDRIERTLQRRTRPLPRGGDYRRGKFQG